MSKMRCCLCGKELEEGEGRSPWPLERAGKCCERCVIMDLLPLRIELMTRQLYEEKEEQDV